MGDGFCVAQNDTFAATKLCSTVVTVVPGGVIASVSEPVSPRVPLGHITIAVLAVGGSGSLNVPEPSNSALICQGRVTGIVEPTGMAGDSVALIWSCIEILPVICPDCGDKIALAAETAMGDDNCSIILPVAWLVIVAIQLCGVRTAVAERGVKVCLMVVLSETRNNRKSNDAQEDYAQLHWPIGVAYQVCSTNVNDSAWILHSEWAIYPPISSCHLHRWEGINTRLTKCFSGRSIRHPQNHHRTA